MIGDHDYVNEESEDGEGTIGLGDAISIVRRRARLIIAMTILLGLAASGYSMTLIDRYDAAATVQIDPRQKKIANIDGVLSELRTDNQTMSSEVEIIQSRSTILRVIEQLNLREDPEFTGAAALPPIVQKVVRAVIARPPAPPSQAPAAPQSTAGSTTAGSTTAAEPATGRQANHEATKPGSNGSGWPDWIGNGLDIADPTRDGLALSVAARLKVQRISNSQLIEVRYTSSDPVKAARIANAVATTYIRSQIEAKNRASQVASTVLDVRLTSLRNKVSKGEREIERFKIDNNLFDPDGRPLDAGEVQRMQQQTQVARSQATEASAKYEQARRMMLLGRDQAALSDVLESPTIRKLQEQYFVTARKEAELSTKYGPKHPDMEKVRAEIARAQAEFANEASKIIQSLKSTYLLADGKARELESQLSTLRQRIDATKEKQWRLRDLEREATATRQLYEAILARAKQTEQSIGLQLPDARLVSEADVPLARTGPKRKLISMAGFAGGLVLGLGLAVLLELGAGGLMRPDDVERRLKVPYLVSLPQMAAARRQSDRMTTIRRMIAEPQGDFAESIRTLRHEIDSRHPTPSGRVVLLTSAQDGEGKTLIAANLALHYAMMGHRAILVDGDLRHMKLSRDLGAAGAPGLLDVLAKRTSLEACILKDRTTGLHLLPAANSNRGLQTALTRERLNGVLAELRSEYDVIVLDSAPLLPVVDTRLMAHYADQVLLVAAWRSTPIKVLKRAIKNLGSNGRKLEGVVLNRVDAGLHASQVGSYQSQHFELPVRSLGRRNSRAA